MLSKQENDPVELAFLSESPYDTPNPAKALDDPEGLVAVGGDLSTTRLTHLYSHGFFPWFSKPDPILWWHPAQRCVLQPQELHISKSLKKSIKRSEWSFSINRDFSSVIDYCSDLRAEKEGTWISEEIKHAYIELHKLGYAHSIEIWQEEKLVGGFYGIAMGRIFFGESMFSLVPNASKVALKQFCELAIGCDIELIDCQVESEHLISLGAKLIPREYFIETLKQAIPTPNPNEKLISLGREGIKHDILP
ncbi:leucyl/phenylalanyl-tRNA--protein transferase [Marinomonas sp. C2222]|uniref:Leucyl/phenylalanyl-tRNA--protein transferase n=1 Tax=Marinomonas sargassi TaxID=2984494 RepID=A0ABT2YN50_9GAMM|nr:leucyl/phenylalanyl-tRNA--protein transferase [Marinomonas sargassi]MCV2401307.1 leucyl/phenylalanyl-tRNA--protein transferase [Marinomonas sargassi]